MNRVRALGLIPDGGRRWARRQGVSLEASYLQSTKVLGATVELLFEYGVGSVAIYLLSKANLKRPVSEIQAVESAVIVLLTEVLPTLEGRMSFDVAVVGDLSLVGEDLRKVIHTSSWAGSSKRHRLYLLVAYDPFDELMECGEVLGKVTSKRGVLELLPVRDEIDLVIRTGGAVTLSNFLPLHASYARLLFLDVLFNDLEPAEVLALVEEHERLTLRYGE